MQSLASKINTPATLRGRVRFKKYHDAHGPTVTFAGQLLFADGSRWPSSLSYEGEPIPPPEDPEQLRNLQITYFVERQKDCEKKHRKLLRELQHLRWMDRMTGRRGDYTEDEQDLAQIEQDYDVCELELARLTNG